MITFNDLKFTKHKLFIVCTQRFCKYAYNARIKDGANIKQHSNKYLTKTNKTNTMNKVLPPKEKAVELVNKLFYKIHLNMDYNQSKYVLPRE